MLKQIQSEHQSDPKIFQLVFPFLVSVVYMNLFFVFKIYQGWVVGISLILGGLTGYFRYVKFRWVA
jgi:hypothetical protein